jgi:hypothetical protein
MKFTFSPNSIVMGEEVQVSGTEEAIEMTMNLRRCSVENAFRFGGKIVRQILETAPISGHYDNVYVETIANFLQIGHIPTQPGWHLDEIPRGVIGDPMQIAGVDMAEHLAAPSLTEMLRQTLEGRRVRFHTVIVGNPCPTLYVSEPLTLDLQHPDDWGYLQEVHQKVRESAPLMVFNSGVGQWITWDWWNLHRPTQARQPGWRLLVRIVEGGQPPMESDFMYPTHHVFVPSTQAL